MKSHLMRAVARVSRATPPFKGKTRLLRTVNEGLRRLGGDDGARLVVDVGGVIFELNPAEHVQFNLLYHGGFGENVLAALVAGVNGGATNVWDVGANVGAISLKLAAACPQVRIQAFEPGPDIGAQLQRNLALNPGLATRITTHRVAVSDQIGTATFYSGGDDNCGTGSLAQLSSRHGAGVEVPTTTGDALVAQGAAPAPQLMKIDVEGFELEVLTGLADVLATHHPTVVFEHGPGHLRQRGQPVDAVLELLRGHGYTFERALSPTETRPLRDADLTQHIDIIAR